ncbi:MAG: hypothetical protein F2796_05145, partial [Actinobacteria bacterium]|nr:hypothetical protein [Actinomycetota bacterium]
MSSVEHDSAAELRREERVEAPLAILPPVLCQSLLAIISLTEGWQIWGLPGWIWLIAIVPELGLMLALSVPGSRRRLERSASRRTVSIALVGVIGAVNAFALVVLIGSLLGA